MPSTFKGFWSNGRNKTAYGYNAKVIVVPLSTLNAWGLASHNNGIFGSTSCGRFAEVQFLGDPDSDEYKSCSLAFQGVNGKYFWTNFGR